MFNFCANIIWQSLSIKLIRAFGFYYLFFEFLPAFIFQFQSLKSNFFIWIILFLFSSVGSVIYETIFIENMRLENYFIGSLLRDKKKRIKKTWIIFRNNFIANIFIFLGLILFIYPGVVLIKRYQYVSLISEDLLLGPIKTFKLSRKISEEKGWHLFNIWFLSSLVASLPVAFLNLITSDLVYNIISALYFPWIRYNTRVLVLMPIYKEYMKKGE